MSDDDYKKYLKLRDNILDDGIKQMSKNELTKDNPEKTDYQKAIRELQTIANEQAKYHLFKNQEKAPDMPVFIKNYKPYKIED